MCAKSERAVYGAHHVFADTGLADVDTEFEQLAVNAWCTPTGILPAHLPDQISGFACNDGASELSVPFCVGTVTGNNDRNAPLLVRIKSRANWTSSGLKLWCITLLRSSTTGRPVEVTLSGLRPRSVRSPCRC